MPKYIPTEEDIYSTKPCFICGRDVVVGDEDTCCDQCRMMKEMWEKDWEDSLWEDYEGEDYA